MKSLVSGLIGLAVISLALGIASKFTYQMLGGVGPRGYLIATGLMLMFAANLALLELIDKKR